MGAGSGGLLPYTTAYISLYVVYHTPAGSGGLLPYTTVYISLYVVYHTPEVYHSSDQISKSQNNNTIYHRGTLYATPPVVSCMPHNHYGTPNIPLGIVFGGLYVAGGLTWG